MADTYIPGQEFRSWTSVPSGGGGLGTVAAAYLAHKAGLIDLNDKKQMDSLQKHGVLGHAAIKSLQGAAKPPSKSNSPVIPKSDVTVGGPMNQELPQGVPLEPMDPFKPKSFDSMGAMGGEDVGVSMLDHELIDSSLANFAALFA